jgi:hypothetical protein
VAKLLADDAIIGLGDGAVCDRLVEGIAQAFRRGGFAHSLYFFALVFSHAAHAVFG